MRGRKAWIERDRRPRARRRGPKVAASAMEGGEIRMRFAPLRRRGDRTFDMRDGAIVLARGMFDEAEMMQGDRMGRFMRQDFAIEARGRGMIAGAVRGKGGGQQLFAIRRGIAPCCFICPHRVARSKDRQNKKLELGFDSIGTERQSPIRSGACAKPVGWFQAMMSGVNWSSICAMRSRSTSLRFFKR